MRIGIDGGCWNVRRGYGQFLRELLSAFDRSGSKHEFRVFLDPFAYEQFHLGTTFKPVRVDCADVVSAASSEGRRSISDLLKMSLAVRGSDVDVFFFPSVYSWFPILDRTPVMLGIHDTIADCNPQFSFESERQHRMWRWKVKLALAQADKILTVSEYSRRCIEQVHHVSPERIRVVYESASPSFRRLDVPRPETRFILYVGGISPNKNLPGLLQAYAKLSARKGRLKLFLVGDYKSDSFKGNYSELVDLANKLGIAGEVVFTGFVPDEELVVLYNQAAVFAMPSFDEGFGLPALEAMACGTPVVVSRGNSLQEVVGDAGLCVDPEDTDGIANALDSVLLNPEVESDLREKAMNRASQFSWDRAAQSILGMLDEIAR